MLNPRACERMVRTPENPPDLTISAIRPNRKAGKQWHAPKSAFRPKAGNSSFAKRLEERKAMDAVKAKEKEMKEEKEAERQVCYPLPYNFSTSIYLVVLEWG